jgi:Cu/Ag efflux pump CusA
MIVGFTQLRYAPADPLPDFSWPNVDIQPEDLGISGHDVEALIATPLAADLFNGVSWAEEIRSESLPSQSSLILVCEKGVDIQWLTETRI